MTAAEIMERCRELRCLHRGDLQNLLLAEIAAQLAEMNARGGVFEFAGEAYARSAVISVGAPWTRSHGDCIFDVEFDRSVVSRRRTFTEAPGATREDFIRLWKGE